jgi:hypothetical protein
MNSQAAQPHSVLSRPLIGRTLAPARDVLRAAANSLLARWRDHTARSRQARTFDDIVDLNPHMLKDIGAPSWLVSRAVTRRDAQYGRL